MLEGAPGSGGGPTPPDDPHERIGADLVRLARGDPGEAFAGTPIARTWLAVMDGKPWHAVGLAFEVLDEDPNDPFALSFLAAQLLGPGSREAALRALVDRHPSLVYPRRQLACAAANDDALSAEATLHALASEHPEDLSLLSCLAGVALRAGDRPAAVGAARQLVSASTRDVYRFDAARRLWGAGERREGMHVAVGLSRRRGWQNRLAPLAILLSGRAPLLAFCGLVVAITAFAAGWAAHDSTSDAWLILLPLIPILFLLPSFAARLLRRALPREQKRLRRDRTKNIARLQRALEGAQLSLPASLDAPPSPPKRRTTIYMTAGVSLTLLAFWIGSAVSPTPPPPEFQGRIVNSACPPSQRDASAPVLIGSSGTALDTVESRVTRSSTGGSCTVTFAAHVPVEESYLIKVPGWPAVRISAPSGSSAWTVNGSSSATGLEWTLSYGSPGASFHQILG